MIDNRNGLANSLGFGSQNSFRPTILTVDGDTSFLSTLCQVIYSSRNCEIVTAADTEEAIEKVIGKKLDLVLTEFMLKSKSSIELFSLIRKNNPGVPIVVITGFPELISETDIRMFGGNQLLTKPLEIHKLRRIINRYCYRPGYIN